MIQLCSYITKRETAARLPACQDAPPNLQGPQYPMCKVHIIPYVQGGTNHPIVQGHVTSYMQGIHAISFSSHMPFNTSELSFTYQHTSKNKEIKLALECVDTFSYLDDRNEASQTEHTLKAKSGNVMFSFATYFNWNTTYNKYRLHHLASFP